MSNWKHIELGGLINFRRGFDLPKTDMISGQYPVVASNGIIGYHNQYTTKAPVITIGRSGNVGTPYFYNENCWAHNTTLVIDAFYDCDPKFIYYILKTLNLQNYRGGSAVPTLNRNHIHPIKVYVPELKEEQQAIADVLSSFDDKIVLNNKIIKNLEEQAQSLYKHWFVDFEFPNEEGKPYKSSGCKFKESELGLIPEKWELSSIDDFVQINKRGISPLYSENHDTPVINQKCIRDSLIDINEITFNDDSKSYSSEIELKFMDTLVNSMGVGTLGRISPYILNIKAVPHSCVTLIRNENYPCFTYLTIKSLEERITQMGTGTTGQTSLNNKSLGALKILVPDKLILKKIEDTIIIHYKELAQLLLENKKLEETRDYLLQKLMKGEIKVGN